MCNSFCTFKLSANAGQTSGTSSISDRPVSKKFIETRVFDDATDDIYEYMIERQNLEVYQQRTTDLVVGETAKHVGVRVYTIMAPPIYGSGTGNFNQLCSQIPLLVNKAIDAGQVLYVGDGMGGKDYVHVSDLANLYELLLGKILEDRDVVPQGRNTIFFAGTGRFRWKDIAIQIAKIGFKLGKLDSSEPRSISLGEALAMGFASTEQMVELTFASRYAHSV
jgi:hypothetical protein